MALALFLSLAWRSAVCLGRIHSDQSLVIFQSTLVVVSPSRSCDLDQWLGFHGYLEERVGGVAVAAPAMRCGAFSVVSKATSG